jgi:hypothetical protein
MEVWPVSLNYVHTAKRSQNDHAEAYSSKDLGGYSHFITMPEPLLNFCSKIDAVVDVGDGVSSDHTVPDEFLLKIEQHFLDLFLESPKKFHNQDCQEQK